MLKILIVLVAAVAYAQGGRFEVGLGSFTKVNPKFAGARIVNGEKADLGEFPYQVSLGLTGLLGLRSHYCGGELLTASTVLTAGHCVTEVQILPTQHVDVLAGAVSLANPGSSGQNRKISKTIVNPDFAGGVAPNDLAIHILAQAFDLNQYVNVIALPQSEAIPSGEVVLSGWGSTSHTSVPSMPDHLQKTTLPIVPYEECLAAVEGEGTPLDDTMVCTGPLSGGYGACNGDSGGPLVSNGTLVGIVSWGFNPCASVGAPSVYTRVSHFLDFINKNTV